MLEKSRNEIPEGARAMPEAPGLTPPGPVDLDVDALRSAIREEYEIVAHDPGRGFHFHTGHTLAAIVGYEDDWLEGIPEAAIESFAGTGNPFSLGPLRPSERVVDVGSGGGIDSLDAALTSLSRVVPSEPKPRAR
jgi:hypothetical protein